MADSDVSMVRLVTSFNKKNLYHKYTDRKTKRWLNHNLDTCNNKEKIRKQSKEWESSLERLPSNKESYLQARN